MERNGSHVSNASVLVIDDDPAVLETSADLLKEYGYNVIRSDNARDAIRRIREEKVDVILTDIKMPDISGIELLEEIRSLEIEVPVILMTAYAELDVAVSAMGKGAFDFIVKPYKPELLIHAVDMAVKHSRW